MVAGDERDDFDLVRLEAAQVAVLDQVVGMAVMALVADVVADVVEQRRVLEPLALAVGQAVDARVWSKSASASRTTCWACSA